MSRQGIAEDVPATVAGFYYQALLACREIIIAYRDRAPDADLSAIKVSIERGADVKIDKGGVINSIEAKLYGGSFNEYSPAVTHSFYNFYKNAFTHSAIQLETNVQINIQSDDLQNFVGEWSKIPETEFGNYIKYLKLCIVYEIYKKYIHSRTQETREIREILSGTAHRNKKDICSHIVGDADLFNNLCSCSGVRCFNDQSDPALLRKITVSSANRLDKPAFISELKTQCVALLEDLRFNDSNLILECLLDAFYHTTTYDHDCVDAYITLERFNEICSTSPTYKFKHIKESDVVRVLKSYEQQDERFKREIDGCSNLTVDAKNDIIKLYGESKSFFCNWMTENDAKMIYDKLTNAVAPPFSLIPRFSKRIAYLLHFMQKNFQDFEILLEENQPYNILLGGLLKFFYKHSDDNEFINFGVEFLKSEMNQHPNAYDKDDGAIILADIGRRICKNNNPKEKEILPYDEHAIDISSPQKTKEWIDLFNILPKSCCECLNCRDDTSCARFKECIK